MTANKLTVFSIILLLVSFFTVGTSSCTDNEVTSTLEELAAVEIREYEGEDLSSIVDFIENSIRGPQYVDIEDYQLDISGLVQNPKKYSYQEVVDNNQNYKKNSGNFHFFPFYL